MRKLLDLNISTRIAVAFSLMVLGALLLALTGWYGMHRQAQVTATAVDRDVQFMRAVSSMRARVQMMRRYEKDMLFNVASPDKVNDYRGKWKDSRRRIDELLLAANRHAVTDAE